MNIDKPNKSALEELMKEVPASSIPLPKPMEVIAHTPVDVNDIHRETWANKSNRLLNDYKYGEGLALYGENDLTTRTFFKRFANIICSIITNECQKRGTSSEDLKPYYNILDAYFLLLQIWSSG